MPRRERLAWFLLAVLPLAAGLMANVSPALSATATAAGATSETDPRLKELPQRFPQADLNRDGVLTAQEVRQARDQFQKQREGAADKSDKAAASAASAARMRQTLPPFAINWIAVFREGGDNKRMMGLHPDNPLSGRVLREAQAQNTK